MKIEPKKGFTWSESDRLQVVSILAKIGYTVSIVKESKEGKTAKSIYVSAE